jgi:hypothetical protein
MVGVTVISMSVPPVASATLCRYSRFVTMAKAAWGSAGNDRLDDRLVDTKSSGSLGLDYKNALLNPHVTVDATDSS